MKIVLSQLNLHIGVSDMGTRKNDLEDSLIKKGSMLASRERIMAKRLLKMIHAQIKYKSLFQNRLELKYEDITSDLESQLNLLQDKFGIKANFKKATDQIKKPSYSSTFRYGLKDLHDKVANDVIKLSGRLWEYQ